MIELLAVIAIVSLLASLLLPTLSRAKAAARRAHCMSNLRQIGIGFSMYTTDHGYYPSSFWAFGNDLSKSGLGLAFDGATGDIIGEFPDTQRLFSCPARVGGLFSLNHYGSGGTQRLQGKLPLLGLGFTAGGHSSEVTRLVGPRPESLITVPSDMIAFGDILWGSVGGTFKYLGAPNEQVSIQVAPSPRFDFDRHQTGANAAFCDGHVEFGTRGRFDTRQDTVRRRWNSDNEPHADLWK